MRATYCTKFILGFCISVTKHEKKKPDAAVTILTFYKFMIADKVQATFTNTKL